MHELEIAKIDLGAACDHLSTTLADAGASEWFIGEAIEGVRRRTWSYWEKLGASRPNPLPIPSSYLLPRAPARAE